MGDVIVRSYGILKSSGLPTMGIVPYLRLNIWLSPQGSKRDGLLPTQKQYFMVGDEDQSIYGFRAAFPQALLDFKKTYPDAKILLMERNYRSTKSIVIPANIFIKQNKGRYEKNMYTENEEGEAVVFKHVKNRNEQYAYLTRFKI